MELSTNIQIKLFSAKYIFKLTKLIFPLETFVSFIQKKNFEGNSQA